MPRRRVTAWCADWGAPARDTARVNELLAALRRLAVDQPMLELRLGELSSLLDEMLG